MNGLYWPTLTNSESFNLLIKELFLIAKSLSVDFMEGVLKLKYIPTYLVTLYM